MWDTMRAMAKRVLILSFSPLVSDARVLRQIRLFSHGHDVVTAGFGKGPEGVTAHIELSSVASDPRRRVWWARVQAVLLRLRLRRAAYWLHPDVRSAMRRLRSIDAHAVIANDIDMVPLSLRLWRSGRVHADLHEYFPGIHDDVPAWRRIRQPFYQLLVRRYVPRTASVTTVAPGIAEKYWEADGVEAQVVLNAPPFIDVEAHPTRKPLRLVHSGAALAGRKIDVMMRAVAASTSDISLDLFLMPNDVQLLASLKRLADELGPTVVVKDPVPAADLVRVLSDYDVGLHVIPANSFNNRHALPNKFFDFVQARLGLVIGPSPEMRRFVEQWGMGAVARDFDVSSLTAVLDSLTPEVVDEWKQASHVAAYELSAQRQVEPWRDAVEKILTSQGGDHEN